MWTLTKKTKKAKYEADNLTLEEVMTELPQLMLYAKHGLVREIQKVYVGVDLSAIIIKCDFEGEETIIIFDKKEGDEA